MKILVTLFDIWTGKPTNELFVTHFNSECQGRNTRVVLRASKITNEISQNYPEEINFAGSKETEQLEISFSDILPGEIRLSLTFYEVISKGI